jgi:hypothetical protein
MRIVTIQLGILLLSTATAVGCGGAGAPNHKLVSAEAAIRGAHEAGASEHPKAKLHLTLAERQVSKAKLFMRDGNNRKASMILVRAQADAELAIALAREQVARAEAEEALKNVEELRAQLKQFRR